MRLPARVPSLFVSSIFALLTVLGCASAPRAERVTALVGVSVVPMDAERVLADQTIVIRGDRISSMGPRASVTVPKDAAVVDAAGKYVIPGLADMHAHLPGDETPRFDMEDYLFLNVARGVTTIRSMRGDPAHLALREKVRSGQLVSPTLILGSPALTDDTDFTAQKARAAVAEYQEAGYDFVKMVGNVNDAAYDALAATAKERRFKLAGHAPPAGLAGAVHARQSSIEHLDPYVKSYRNDATVLASLVKEQADAGLCACPDVYWYDVMWHLRSPEDLEKTDGLAYVPRALVSEWVKELKDDLDERRAKDSKKLEADLARYRENDGIAAKVLKSMQKAGVPLLVSPGDGPFIVPGFSMLEEMRIFRKAGLSNYEVLRAATSNAERFFGRKNQGSVAVGKKADLVLLAGNPLADIDNVGSVEGVALRGRWIPKREIDERLARIAAKNGR